MSHDGWCTQYTSGRITSATKEHLTSGRFRLEATFPSTGVLEADAEPVPRGYIGLRPRKQGTAVWNPIPGADGRFNLYPDALQREVAIPHRLFMSWFRPASLTACPPREPPPLFEQEHRNLQEFDELGLGKTGTLLSVIEYFMLFL